MRFNVRVVVIVVLAGLAASSVALAGGSGGRGLDGPKHRAIVVFKGATARSRVLAELRQAHATGIQGFALIDAVSANVSAAESTRLARNPAVVAVVPDAFRPFAPAATQQAGLGAVSAPSGSPLFRTLPALPPQQICPSNPAQPLIEPEALDVMNVAAAHQFADGTGIKVGVIADGIDVNNPDLIRQGGSHVVVDYQDFSGFGTAVPTDGRRAFLGASTIAAQGYQTYDLSGFVNPAHPLPPGCNIKIEGVAPGASLVMLDVAGSAAGASDSQIVQAIQYAVEVDHVNVLDESFVGSLFPDTRDDPVALANRAAVARGVTVVVGSDNSGPYGDTGASQPATPTSPPSGPGVITVGGTTTFQLYRQTTRAVSQLSPGGWLNNNIAGLSSSGVHESGPSTVNVVAPADSVWSLCSSNTAQFNGCADPDHGANPPPIWMGSGAGASSGEAAATAALVMQAYASTHGGTMPTPALVKQIIVSTATDLGAPADHQGAGLLNAQKAVQLAESIGSSSPQGSTLLVSQPALTATGPAGASQQFTVGVTNESSTSQTVTPTISGLPSVLSADTGSVTLSPASPTLIDGEGRTDYYAVHQFSVPAGADYLNGDITWNGASIGGVAFETIFGPNGSLAAYSFLGSNQSGFGHVEVSHPAAGVWTAVIFTVSNAPYFGPVQFAYTTQAFHSTGSVSPSALTLGPGQSGNVQVTVTMPQAGDEAVSLHLATGSSTDGAIPIVLRSLVPLGAQGGSFAGTLTGGGGTGHSGQTFSYQFRLSGQPSLNVGIQLADSNYRVEGFLVDPSGQPVDVQSTADFDANDNLLGYGSKLQFFRGRPAAGLWTLTLLYAGPGDGAHLSEPFTGSISFTGPPIGSSGVPNSPGTSLNHPVTATMNVTNTGTVRKDFFADARLATPAQQQLLGTNVNNVLLPLAGPPPTWLVPTETTRLVVTGQGTVPITMNVAYAGGDPDVLGVSSGTNSVAAIAAPEIAPGVFDAYPSATGPFSSPVSGSVNLTAVATTRPFDSTVTSSTGDLWAQSVNAAAPYTPLSLAPGQSGAVTVTFAPSGPVGSVGSGTIAVDTFDSATESGDELTAIPYAYRVG
jgi:hypothetical protein